MKNTIRSRRRNRRKQRVQVTPFVLREIGLDGYKKSIDAMFASFEGSYEAIRSTANFFNNAIAQFELYPTHRYFFFGLEQPLMPESPFEGCKFNAHSIYLQCAVNPTGNCSKCDHWERLA